MSKRVGAIPEETREWILSAARDEFSKNGFQKSSLRRICSTAGVTTGALYFFFKGKDDLFTTVLSEVTEPFLKLLNEHYEEERREQEEAEEKDCDADFEVSRLMIELYFCHQQTFDILVHHLDHPSVQAFLDEFIDTSTEHYMYRLTRANPGFEKNPPDRFAIHQFVHMQVDTMLTLISHDYSQEEMIRHSRTIVKMLKGAFGALLTE